MAKIRGSEQFPATGKTHASMPANASVKSKALFPFQRERGDGGVVVTVSCKTL